MVIHTGRHLIFLIRDTTLVFAIVLILSLFFCPLLFSPKNFWCEVPFFLEKHNNNNNNNNNNMVCVYVLSVEQCGASFMFYAHWSNKLHTSAHFENTGARNAICKCNDKVKLGIHCSTLNTSKHKIIIRSMVA
jgi:hypothetical protein